MPSSNRAVVGTGVESGSENDVEESQICPEAPGVTGRKKNTWKGFNLKRQLSKVDLKLKTTFTGSSSQCAGTAPTQIQTQNQSQSQIQSQQKKFSEASGPEVETSSVPVFASCSPRHAEVFEEIPENVEPVDGSGENSNIHQCGNSSPGSEATPLNHTTNYGPIQESVIALPPIPQTDLHAVERPDELALFDNDGRPIRPRRDPTKKSGSRIAGGHRRENRLLSVPHVKYQRNDPAIPFADIKSREDVNPGGGPSFAENLMRRFSKFLNRKSLYVTASRYCRTYYHCISMIVTS